MESDRSTVESGFWASRFTFGKPSGHHLWEQVLIGPQARGGWGAGTVCGTGQCRELLALGQAGRVAVAVEEGCVQHLLWARHLGSLRGRPHPGVDSSTL